MKERRAKTPMKAKKSKDTHEIIKRAETPMKKSEKSKVTLEVFELKHRLFADTVVAIRSWGRAKTPMKKQKTRAKTPMKRTRAKTPMRKQSKDTHEKERAKEQR